MHLPFSTNDLKTDILFRKKSHHQGTCILLSMQHCYSLFLCFEYCTLNTLKTLIVTELNKNSSWILGGFFYCCCSDSRKHSSIPNKYTIASTLQRRLSHNIIQGLLSICLTKSFFLHVLFFLACLCFSLALFLFFNFKVTTPNIHKLCPFTVYVKFDNNKY